MQMPIYRAASRELLNQATDDLAAGDSRGASGKAWDSAAQMLEAVAEQRGWQHDNNFLLFQTTVRLTEETGDEQFIALFHIAASLHTNYCEDWEPPEMVASGIRAVGRLLDKLEPLLGQP